VRWRLSLAFFAAAAWTATVAAGAPAHAPSPSPPRSPSPPPSPSPSPSPSPYLALGEEIVAAVRDNFFDAARAEAWARRHRGYGAAPQEWFAFAARTNQLLAELATSHTGFYPRGGGEQPMLSAIFAEGLKTRPVHASLGVDLARMAGGLFVRRVFPGGPAQAAGVLRGDRIVSVDGKPPAPELPLVSGAGRPVRLVVERAPHQPTIELAPVPALVNPKQEWLAMQRDGSTIVERDGERIGYHPMFSCAGAEHEAALRASLVGPLASAAALVLDFRDGWGGCQADLVGLFNPTAPIVTAIGRAGTRSISSPVWRRPVVLLVNGGSRSGKEMVAFVLKKHHLAVLVGERTAGAVMTGRAFRLSDGSLLYLAVADVMVDDHRLEGVGVAPDVEVRDSLAFAQGKDPQLDRALAVAADEVKRRRARPAPQLRPVGAR
jgi:carboxyl-terminal processing protease